MKIIAVANQKGGVGKTTTAINIAAGLELAHKKVLLIDLDPQGNSSTGLGVDITLLTKTVFDALILDTDVNKIIRKTLMRNLDLLPANLKLSNLESEIAQISKTPFFILKNCIAQIKKQYDYVLIDCPPSLGILCINALTAANTVLIPVQCEYFALEGLAQILSIIRQVQQSHNPKLQIEGFLLTMFESRSKLALEIRDEVRSLFKEETFVNEIPRNISISEASAKGLPGVLYRPSSAGSIAYINVCKEIISNEKR